MTDDPQLLKDARRYGIELAAQRPETVSLCCLQIRWTGSRWVLRTSIGTPVAFANHPQDLRDFARLQFWATPTGPLLEELPNFTLKETIMSDAHTLTETPAADTAQAALDAINELKAQATATLDNELRGIADAAGTESVDLRLRRKSSLDHLVGAAAWLARDLVDVLVKVAAGTDPHSVMGSDLPARIREAEVRLQLLREMSR